MFKNYKIIILVLTILLILAFLIKPKEVKIKEDLLNINYNINNNETKLKYETDNPVVALYIKNYGSVVIELYPDIASNTVNNFIELIKKGFYDNNTFHRLVPGFVLQGGDPEGNGTGGPGYNITAEFSENISHEKWMVSMARSSNPDSAGSQFFICLEDAKHLDNQYTIFGKVIDGYKNIEKIVDNETVIDSNSGKLQTNLVLKKAIVDLKGKDYPEADKIEK